MSIIKTGDRPTLSRKIESFLKSVCNDGAFCESVSLLAVGCVAFVTMGVALSSIAY
jgi:hypothetical protein